MTSQSRDARRRRRIPGWMMPAVAMVLAASIAAAAQEKPDFTGRWILESPAPSDPDAPRALVVRRSPARANAPGEPPPPLVGGLTVDRELESGTRSETLAIGVVGGMTPGLNEGGTTSGPRSEHSVRWEGDTLAIERGSHTGPAPETGVWSHRREVWSLDSDGRLRVVITTRGSAAEARTITLLYRRQ